MSIYPDTYYARTLREVAQRPVLEGTHDFDVIVVGGGLAGLTAALELARAGRSVGVLEAERAGWGASGRNGGFVGPGFATSSANIRRMVGVDRARELHQLSIEGVHIVSANIRDLGITTANPVYGKMSVLRYDDPAGLEARRDALEREFGYKVEVMPTESVREVLQSKKYFQALYDPACFHIHPLEYAQALASAVERLGGKVFEQSRATSIQAAGARKVVTTRHGRATAQHVILASGGYSDYLVPRIRRSILPIATYVLVTEPAREQIATALRTNAAISDNRRAGDYYRLVDNGDRILWGGRITTRTSEPRRLADLLRRTMLSTYPQLEGIRVAAAWSGLMAYARHLMPLVGQAQPGVWHVLGFGGHGLNTTAIGGRVVAEGILGTSDRYRLFEPFGLTWNGGPFGVAAAQLTYWALQAMDFAREYRAARAA